MSAQKPFIDPAFGTGLHAHLAQARVRRFALRFNNDSFLSPRELREALAREELPFAA
jgi:hypothetical protein